MEPFALLLAAVLAQTSADTLPPAAPTQPAMRADGDRDGAISRAEYLARFDRMDIDHDGMLTREERRAAMPRLGGRRGGREERGPGDRPAPPPAADTSRADFLARAGEQFDRLDANRDGKIEPAEWRAGRGSRGDMSPAPVPAR